MRILFSIIASIYIGGCAQIPYTPVPGPTPNQKHAVVFDIDGTLTPSVLAVFEARTDASKAVNAYADKGYKIVYLSSRTPLFSSGIPSWLQRNDFPKGSVHVAQTPQEREHPDVYKTRVLKEFQARGWIFDYAFGDSSTDMAAYSAANIPSNHVFALLRRGQTACQPGPAIACLSGWTEHISFIESSVPPIEQRPSDKTL